MSRYERHLPACAWKLAQPPLDVSHAALSSVPPERQVLCRSCKAPAAGCPFSV